MTTVSGTFNGTGSALYVGCGFVPDWVKIRNLESTFPFEIEWSANMRSSEQEEGISLGNATVAAASPGTPLTRLANAAGIAAYLGGTTVTAASTVYLVKDTDPDKRDNGTGATISTWTLGNSGNRTGNWNDVCNTTFVGEGSRIWVKQDVDQQVRKAVVTALTSNGEAANEVELSLALSTGTVVGLSGMYDYIGAAANTIIPAGFYLASTGTINTSGEMCMFSAGTYDTDH